MRALTIAGVAFLGLMSLSAGKSPIEWGAFDKQVFDRAGREDRLVILYLEAVWCHWCHVMDETTYADPRVIDLLSRGFVPTREDSDARLDLANRYRAYGWPATIIFDAKGRELAKRKGYLEADEMLELLERLARDPTPETTDVPPKLADAPKTATLSEETRAQWRALHASAYDEKTAGLRFAKKFLDRDSVEWAMRRAARGDAQERTRALKTLRAAARLVDPVWGGVYQYSTGFDWKTPHYEKLMSTQATYLRMYGLGTTLFPDAIMRSVPRKTVGYLNRFLRSPEGAFYVSQDADVVPGKKSTGYFALSDRARRAQGTPRVDTNVYARENGWAIEALAELAAIDPGSEAGILAETAAARMLATHLMEDGAFRHAASDVSADYLVDTLAMGRGLLALHALTGAPEALQAAERAGLALRRFAHDPAGFATARMEGSVLTTPTFDFEENLQAVRFTNLLFHYTENMELQRLAEHGFRYLAIPSHAAAGVTEAGVLLADDEMSRAPMHLSIVGPLGDAKATQLWRAAHRFPSNYKRVERIDPAAEATQETGSQAGAAVPLAQASRARSSNRIRYPKLSRPAAFICSANSCSAPIFEPERVVPTALKLEAQ